MKKLLTIVLAVICALSMVAFTACNGEHQCDFSKEVVSINYLKSEATCQSKATYYKSCSCGEKGEETFEVGAVAPHDYVEGKCKWCQADEPENHTHEYTEQVSEEFRKSEATCESKAIYYKSCSCGEKSEETFEVGVIGNHDYVDGICKWCGEEAFDGQVTPEEWLNAIAEETFNNVTIMYEYTIVNYGNTGSTFYIADGRVERRHGELGIVEIYEDELAEVQKNVLLQMFIGLLSQYEEFEFDAEEGVYIAPNEVTVQFDSPFGDYYSTEHMTNGRIKFSSDYRVEQFTCDLVETVYIPGEVPHSQTMLDMNWYFYDYGTTVTQEVPVVPLVPELEYGLGSEEEWIKAVNISENCVINARQSAFEQGIFMYYSDSEIIRYNEVFKLDDVYYRKDGTSYSYYYKNNEGQYEMHEYFEHGYQYQTTIYLFEGIFDELTFDEASGLYLADEVVVSESEYITVKNVKAGFVDGKLAYLTYEEESGSESFVYEYSFEFKDVEITFPPVI